MQKERLNAYLAIIQELLTCPNGEEWIRLRQHESLVNPELVEVMEQVANQMAAGGDAASARFLHSWASKLHHILREPPAAPEPSQEKTQAYRELVQALLECPPSQRVALLQANSHLLEPGLAEMMKQAAHQLRQQGQLDEADFLRALANEVTKFWMETQAFQPRLKKDAPEYVPPERTSPAPVTASAPAPAPPMPPPSASPPIALDAASLQHLEQHLAAIAQALNRLTDLLTQRAIPDEHPLKHLAALEEAANQGWILSTEEVENLIGVKPHCAGGDTTYHRGNWQFVKAGHLGNQLGWHVVKSPNSEVPVMQ